MSDTHNKLQYGNNCNHWKILDLDIDAFIFIFLILNQILTGQTNLNAKPSAPIISFLGVFDVLNITLFMWTWREVRNLANQKFRLTPARDVHGPGLDLTGIGLKAILAGSGLDRIAFFW